MPNQSFIEQNNFSNISHMMSLTEQLSDNFEEVENKTEGQEMEIEAFGKEKHDEGKGECKNKDDCTFLRGNNADIDIDKYDCEVRSDIVVSEERSVRIWGQIINCHGKGVGGALVKLIAIEPQDCKKKSYGVAHTVSDCDGYYQFDVPDCENKKHYKVLVGKAATGKEKVLHGNESCDPCKEDPCKK